MSDLHIWITNLPVRIVFYDSRNRTVIYYDRDEFPDNSLMRHILPYAPI